MTSNDEPIFTQAAYDAAVANAVAATLRDLEPGYAAAIAAAVAKTAKLAVGEVRARVAAIIGCEAAKGRGALALHFALETDMSPEVAAAALAMAAPEAAASPSRMHATRQPSVTANGAPDRQSQIDAMYDDIAKGLNAPLPH